MKHTLLLLIFLPLFAAAHRDDPRKRSEAPYAGVHTVKTTTFFTLPKENNKSDTCSIETDWYSADGLLTQHSYAMILPKSPRYDYQEKLSYAAPDAWTKRVYKNGVLSDSILVNGSVAKCYSFSAGQPRALYEYKGDSMQEKMINGRDTVFRAKKTTLNPNTDAFWDYDHAGTFARVAVSRSLYGPDTVSYFDAAGKCLAQYIRHYTGNGATARIDYYNYGVKTFHFRRLTYSDKLEMTFFLEKSRKGHWSYQVLYTYNDREQLIEERWVDANPKRNEVVKKYEYVFY